MKLMIGFTAGFVAGAVVYSKLSHEQRAEIEAKFDELWSKGRTGEIRKTATDGVGDVADAVTARVADATETVTDVAADKVGGNSAASDSAPTIRSA
jgi:hypothetical protein